jgi:hypothetical protein
VYNGGFPLSSLVDNICRLNWVDWRFLPLGLTVAKMRANPANRTPHECEIGKGMHVLPQELEGAIPHLFAVL